ncbi:MAG: hypothetical protein HY826_03760 [Actinobacteria bacterium]|nr:hypothetical protein [Actinomycetota bacterium]
MKAQALKVYGLAIVTTLAGCSSDGTTLPTPADAPAATSPSSLGDDGDVQVTTPPDNSSATIVTDDNCHVDITGDINASFDSGGGFSNIGYGPWVPGSAVTVAGVTLDDTFFILNCQGGEGELVSIGLGLDQHLPMTPANYPIRKADNIFGGYDSNPPVIQVSPYIGSGDFFWAISADSVFNITEFDATHIAGNFQFYVSEAKNDIVTDGLPAKTAVITGAFNIKNPN